MGELLSILQASVRGAGHEMLGITSEWPYLLTPKTPSPMLCEHGAFDVQKFRKSIDLQIGEAQVVSDL